MILDNRTRYRSADLERIILLALEEAGITAHARERVTVCYGSGISGWCYYGHVAPGKLASGRRKARMALRVPDPDKPSRLRRRLEQRAAGVCPTHAKVVCTPDGEPPMPPYRPGSQFMRCPHGCRWIQSPSEPSEPSADEPFDVQSFVWLVRHEVGHWRGLAHTQMGPTIRHWKSWEAAGRPLPAWASGLTVALEDAKPARPRKPPPDRDAERAEREAHARAMLARAERKARLAETLVKRWARRVRAAEQAIARAAVKAGRS